VEETEFQRAWTSKFHDSCSNQKGSERAKEKGYVLISFLLYFSQPGFLCGNQKEHFLDCVCFKEGGKCSWFLRVRCTAFWNLGRAVCWMYYLLSEHLAVHLYLKQFLIFLSWIAKSNNSKWEKESGYTAIICSSWTSTLTLCVICYINRSHLIVTMQRLFCLNFSNKSQFF